MNTVELGLYRHYKGGEYEVVGTALHESELYRLVIYKPLTAGSKLDGTAIDFWARPEDDFKAMVEIGEFDYGTYKKVPRFERIK